MKDNPGLPAEIHPEDLPSLVEQVGGVLGPWDDYAEAEDDVRQCYDLAQMPLDQLRARSWVDRAKDLVVHGWAKVREIFQRAETKPDETVREPKPVEQWDPVADVIARVNAMMAQRDEESRQAREAEQRQREALERDLRQPQKPSESQPRNPEGPTRGR